MADPLEFYFDFSSTYGYIGSHLIEALAAKHGRKVVWKPILLGAVNKITGLPPLPSVPLKGDYAKRDVLRSARRAVLGGLAFAALGAALWLRGPLLRALEEIRRVEWSFIGEYFGGLLRPDLSGDALSSALAGLASRSRSPGWGRAGSSTACAGSASRDARWTSCAATS